MRPYAARTDVPIERSRENVEKLLKKYGADQFGYHDSGTVHTIMFRMAGRIIRLRLLAGEGKGTRGEQETRRRWRVLELVLKAKLEAIHSGVLSMDEEFLPYMQLSSGQTVGEWAVKNVLSAIESGKLPFSLALEAGS